MSIFLCLILIPCLFGLGFTFIFGVVRLSDFLEYDLGFSSNTATGLSFLFFPLAPVAFVVLLVKDLYKDIKKRRIFRNDNRY